MQANHFNPINDPVTLAQYNIKQVIQLRREIIKLLILTKADFDDDNTEAIARYEHLIDIESIAMDNDQRNLELLDRDWETGV